MLNGSLVPNGEERIKGHSSRKKTRKEKKKGRGQSLRNITKKKKIRLTVLKS